MDVRGWLLFIRDWLLVLLVGMALAAAAAFIISSLLPKTYQAETRLLVGQSLTGPNPDYTQLLASQVIAQTYAEVATARPSLERVISDLALDTTPEELAAAVGVRAPANSTLIVITAEAGTPALSAQIANGLADVLLEGLEAEPIADVTPEDLTRLDAEIGSITDQIGELLTQGTLTAAQQARLTLLQDQRDTLREERSSVLQQLTSSANRLTVIEPAIAPTDPSSPRVVFNTAIGAFIGLVITALATYAFESSERRSGATVRAPGPMAVPRPRRTG
jgi:capsular polysaccharide biosynthesis protein